MEILKDCTVCFFSYDTQKHAPRSLPCGHTLCSECLKNMVSLPHLRKCPFDNSAFTSSQNSVDSFPLNFVLLAFLEQKHSDTCQIHGGKKLKLICLTDQRKLCSDCVKDEEHNGHTIRKIKELKAQGAKMKDELESTLVQIRNYEENKDSICEIIRKNFISNIDEQFEEIKDIIVEKKFKLVNYVNNIFSADKEKDCEDTFALKQQLDETIKDIKYASNDNGDLILLENTLNTDRNLVKMLPQILQKRSLGVRRKLLKMQRSLEQSLQNSKEIVSALQLSSEEVVKEIYSVKEGREPLSEAELSKIYQKLQTLKFVSYCNVQKTLEGLEISMCPDQPKEIEVNDGDFKAVEAIDIKLGRYDLLMKEPNSNLLTFLFRSGLEKLTSLEISCDSREFNGSLVVWLAKIISDSVQSLKSLCVDLEKCHVCGEALISFCDLVFPKMGDLKDFYLYLNSSEIHSEVLEIWINALTPLQKNLECFALGLTNNKLTDGEFYQVYQMIQTMGGLKNLQLILSGTKITDKSLEIIGETVLPRLKALDSFTLSVNKCQISDSGIVRVLKNLPNLKNLELYLSRTLITDQTVDVLVNEVVPRLEPLASLTFIAKNTQVRSRSFWEFRTIVIKPENKEEH